MNATRKRGPGRPSKEEELKQFAEHAGIDPELVGEYVKAALPAPPKQPKPTEDAPPEDWAEWEAEMMRLLWINRADLKGIAMVQALKAIATLAEHQRDREGPDDGEDDRKPLLDRLEALPKAHAAKLLKQEIGRLDELRAEYFAALERLEAE